MNKIRSKSGVRKGMKRYARRKSRYTLTGKYYLSNDVTRAQVEYYDQIAIGIGASEVQFATTGNKQLAIVAILSASTSFQDLFPIYARYKITGLSMRCSIGQSVDVICAGIASGPPSCSAAFYPNLTGTNIGANPSYNDHKMIMEPGVSAVQSKYWRFPDQYFEGAGFGFGVWSQTNGYTNQIGQLSITANKTPSTASASVFLFNVRVTLYLMFSDKNR